MLIKESGVDSGQGIATISEAGGEGSLEFEPANGSAGERKLEAVISTGGLPGRTLLLGTYTAPGPVLPGAVGGLSVTPGGEGAEVRWSETSDTATYQALIETSGGRSFLQRVNQGSERLVEVPSLTSGETVTATVTTVDAQDREGGKATASAVIGTTPPGPPAPPGPYAAATGPSGNSTGAGAGAAAGGTPAAGRAALKLRSLTSRSGVVTVALSCTGGPCSGTLALTVKEPAHKVKGRKVKAKILTLASVRYSMAAGAGKQYSLHLSAAALRLLKADHGRLAALAAVTPSGVKAAPSVAVLIKALAPKTKSKR